MLHIPAHKNAAAPAGQVHRDHWMYGLYFEQECDLPLPAWADELIDQGEAADWDAQQKQVLWAEAGGYSAGLPRPAEPRAKLIDSDWDDIPY